MAITPQTNIKLLKVPIEIDNKNQLKFSSYQTQYNYFNSLPQLEIDNVTYQRKDNIIRYPEHVDDLIEFNYCIYQNENYGSKWFYAYITSMRYVNDNMTEISIETDVWQTWQLDLTFKKSFVTREHVSDDTIGVHTLPEQLESGEYVLNQDATLLGLNQGCVCIASNYNPYLGTAGDVVKTDYYNGLFSGITYFIFPDVSGSGSDSASSFIYALTKGGHLDAIQGVFIVPKDLVDYIDIGDPGYLTYWTPVEEGLVTNWYRKLPASYAVKLLFSTSIPKSYTSINGYTPKNKKLFTYPYNFMQIDNNAGSVCEYRYEDFATTDASFLVKGAITPGCSIKMIPLQYKGNSENYNESITAPKFPICNWYSDTYTNWLTQNSLNIGMNITSSAIQLVGSAVTKDIGGAMNGVGGIANSLLQIYQAQFMSPQTAGNTNSGDVTYSDNKLDLIIYKKCIKAEYARIIDDYFSMFGYKVNTLKIPNITGRSNWNYVKTIDVNVVGDIPQGDLQIIKNMFNNGVTIWHNTSTFLDYSQNNPIV